MNTGPTPLAFPLEIHCMIEAHGRLYTYVSVDGNICVRACDQCLAENSRLEDERWKQDLAEAIA